MGEALNFVQQTLEEMDRCHIQEVIFLDTVFDLLHGQSKTLARVLAPKKLVDIERIRVEVLENPQCRRKAFTQIR